MNNLIHLTTPSRKGVLPVSEKKLSACSLHSASLNAHFLRAFRLEAQTPRRPRRPSSSPIISIFLALAATTLAHAEDRFVSPSGNDANNGLTPESAFRSVTAAAKATPAGAHTIRNNRLNDNGLPHKQSCSGALQLGHMTDCTIAHNTIRDNAFWNRNPVGTNSQTADPNLTREPDGDRLLKLAADSPVLKAGYGTAGGNWLSVSK